MKSITDKRILIIFGLFLGCLIINSFSDVNKEVYAADLEKRVQTVDPVLEAKFLLMERGKIPIGECVDEAEDLAQKIIDGMDTLNENIEEEMSAGNGLIWMPEDCKCGNCSNHCDCEYDDEGKCTSCHCTSCEGDVCPFDEIKKQVDAIQDADDKIIKSTQRLKDLIEAKNLEQYDPDRWVILNKLRNSRYKMEECVQGFESALKHPRTEINFLSCRTALNEIDRERGGLVLLEYFENHISDYPYCYPYTANSAIREICKDNRVSDDCHIPLKGCMDNYFCAGFVGPFGDLGGNKEGDEPQVKEGEMPICSSLYTPADDVPADDGSDDGSGDGSDDTPDDDTLPDGVPKDSLCVQRMLKILADGTEFDIVRGTNHLLTEEEILYWKKTVGDSEQYNINYGTLPFSQWVNYLYRHNTLKYGFNCNDVCNDLGQVCVGIGLNTVENTYCRYVVHNHGRNCQLSENLGWGECDIFFPEGNGACVDPFYDTSLGYPNDYRSFGLFGTACYCIDEYPE